jgi:hypothetical protein
MLEGLPSCGAVWATFAAFAAPSGCPQPFNKIQIITKDTNMKRALLLLTITVCDLAGQNNALPVRTAKDMLKPKSLTMILQRLAKTMPSNAKKAARR